MYRLVAALLGSALGLGPLHAADPLAEPNAAAVIAAIEAADGLSTLSERDLAVIARDMNRDRFQQESTDGGTLLDGRWGLRLKTERIVLAMGEVKGKYAELALLVRELWNLADAEAALVTGAEPIDDAFAARTSELMAKTAALRAKMRRLLPAGVEVGEPSPP
jgi:hypothetical protein